MTSSFMSFNTLSGNLQPIPERGGANPKPLANHWIEVIVIIIILFFL